MKGPGVTCRTVKPLNICTLKRIRHCRHSQSKLLNIRRTGEGALYFTIRRL